MKSKHLLLVIVVCFARLQSIAAFDIDKTALNVAVIGSEITVTVPDEPELISVFFSTELGDECTSGYTFVYNPNNSSDLSYKQDIKKNLKNDDELRIVGIFQTTDQFIRKEFDFKIDEQNNAIKQDITPLCDCEPSQTEQDAKVLKECSGTLIFSDDFNDTLDKWRHEVRIRIFEEPPLQEFVAYVKHTNNSYLQNGYLNLKATWMAGRSRIQKTLEGCTPTAEGSIALQCGPLKWGPRAPLVPVYTAKLHNKDNFSFKFGRVEIRARFPIGDWLFPYLVLQPSNIRVESPYVNHIRIAYARGNVGKFQDTMLNEIGGRTVFGSAVLWVNEGKHIEFMHSMSTTEHRHFGEEFHNYTMIWRKDRIIFKVDGNNYGTITNPTVLNEINRNEHFIALGLTVGGEVNFRDDYVMKEHKPFRNDYPQIIQYFQDDIKPDWPQPTLEIDYVRVYTIHKHEE